MPASKKSAILLTSPERTRDGPRVSMPKPADAAAVRALAWLARGEPEHEIIYDEAAPKQTPEELAAFRKASYRKVKPLRP